VGIIIVLAVLQAILLAAGWSCAKSYYERGRRWGLEQAAAEILRGAQTSLGSKDAAVPKPVLKALAAHKRAIANPTMPCEPALWDVGHAIGEGCWRNGYSEGVKVEAKPEDRIRLDLSLAELLQMSWLAHLGFQHMMPNYRGFEVHRFSGADDACEGARSVAILECALPRSERPFADLKTQILNRERLITGWWTIAPEQLPADRASAA
jgi:hypothetical protein